MTVPTQHWTVDEVTKYISSLEIDGFSYSDCCDPFKKEIINGKLFLNLDKDDLNVLGVTQFAKRNALFQHIQKLKQSAPLPATSIKNNKNKINKNNSNNNSNNNLSGPGGSVSKAHDESTSLSFTFSHSTKQSPHAQVITFNNNRSNQQNNSNYSLHSPSLINRNNTNNNLNQLSAPIANNNHSMTPLILPQTPISAITASPHSPINLIQQRTNNNNKYSRNASSSSSASTTSFTPFHMNSFNSPIFNSHFAQITSPQHPHSTSKTNPQHSTTIFSPNFVPNLMVATHQLMANTANISTMSLPNIHSVPNRNSMNSINNMSNMVSNMDLSQIYNPQQNTNNPNNNKTIITPHRLQQTTQLQLQPQHHQLSLNTPHPHQAHAHINTNIEQIPNQHHLYSLSGIYQGVNSHNTTFILMAQENIIALNHLYEQFNIIDDDINNNNNDEIKDNPNPNPKTNRIKRRNLLSPLQRFECLIPTEKVQHGWILNNETKKLPFNPLIRFILNILTNEIISISPLMISGHINHINHYKQIWVTSDLQIDAIEEVNSIPSALIGGIISLRLTNISHKSLQQRDASYMIHDPEHHDDYQMYKGLKVQFCLKLSTRTNKKSTNTRKPVFVQAWNVKPDQ